ncbi:MAG: LTA synthase family protein [Lysobacteraceae bacterium]
MPADQAPPAASPADRAPVPPSRWAWLLALPALASTLAVPWLLFRPDDAFNWPLAVATSFPWLLAGITALALTRRPLLSAALVWSLGHALDAINDIKLRQLGLPIMPGDTHALAQVVQTPLLYLRYVQFDALVVAWLAALALLWRLERPLLRPLGAPRLLLIAVSALLLAGMPLRWQPWQHVYQQKHLRIMVWRPDQAASHAGWTAFFFHLQQYARPLIPPPDPAALRDHAQLPQDAGWTAQDAPLAGADVLVIQSESFFDPGLLQGVEGGDYIPNFHRLAAQSSHGRLRVPTFGGLTTRTEFEFLTAYPLAGAEDFQYPYQALLNRRIHALPWSFRRQGYAARAMHPYDRRFYSRDIAYPHLGFMSFHGVSEFTGRDHHGFYVSDAAMTRRIIEIAEAGIDAPLFLFAVSMENHGPWTERRPLDEAALPPLPQGHPLDDAEDALVMRRFLHHLQRSDAALGELADWVMARQRPTAVLFFGDHLPQLEGVIDRWPFVNGDSAGRQRPPWLLFANRPLADVSADLDSSQLGALLARLAGLDDPLFDAVERLRHSPVAARRADRLRLQSALAAQHLSTPPDDIEETPWQTAQLVQLLDWWPQGAEQSHQRDGKLVLRLTFAEPPPRDAFLTLGGHRLRVHRHGQRWHGELEAALAHGLRARPGGFDLVLKDALSRQQQILGQFLVRPRAPRVALGDGRGESPFCAIEEWGPARTSLAAPANPQPDGGLGLWLLAACLPPSASLSIDGQPLDTFVNDRKATAIVPAGLLRAGRNYPLRLLDADQAFDIGVIQVTE